MVAIGESSRANQSSGSNLSNVGLSLALNPILGLSFLVYVSLVIAAISLSFLYVVSATTLGRNSTSDHGTLCFESPVWKAAF